jgi:hypothetical protein
MQFILNLIHYDNYAYRIILKKQYILLWSIVCMKTSSFRICFICFHQCTNIITFVDLIYW